MVKRKVRRTTKSKVARTTKRRSTTRRKEPRNPFGIGKVQTLI